MHKPVRIATRLGIFGEVMHAMVPRIAQIIMNTTFRMFPDSDAAKGAKDGEKVKASADQIAFANLMRGIHFSVSTVCKPSSRGGNCVPAPLS